MNGNFLFISEQKKLLSYDINAYKNRNMKPVKII